VRDGALALRLALDVRERTGGRDPRALDTLAAAYAASGRLDMARETWSQAAALAHQLGDIDAADEIAAHARGYRR
jgi:Flp pilus assembly protein TadD